MQDIVGLYRHLRCWALLGWVAIFVQAENAQQSLSRDEAIDEIVADASMDRMGDKSFWQAVAENLGEDRAEVRGKIAQFFDKYLGKIKEALRTKQVFMSRVNVARLEKQMQDALSALYAEGIREAAKNRKALTGTATETKNAATEGSEVQYSFRNTTSGMANDELLQYDAGLRSTIEQQGGIIIDNFDALVSVVDMVFDQPNKKATAYFGILSNDVLDSITADTPNIPKDRNGLLFKKGKQYSVAANLDDIRHLVNERHLSREETVDYLDRLADTIVDRDSVAFSYYVDSQKQQTLGLKFKKQFSDGVIESFDLISNKKRTLTMHTMYMEKGDYVKRKSAKTPLNAKPSTQTPKAQAGQTSNSNIAQEKQSVKPGVQKKSSRPTTDSTGRELSEGQQAYFKDSRARDINGNLLVLYHQTENKFTVFDPRHKGAGTRDEQTPFGIFLKSSDRDIGVKGKKQMALYANITKPLVALNRENLESKLRDMFPEYAKLSDQHKALDQEYKQKHEQAKQAFTDYLAAWRKQHPNAGRSEIYQDADFDRLWNAEDDVIEEWEQKARELETETKEVLTNALEAAGYDGIFLGSDTGSWGRSTDAYIALRPEQVKNVNNLNPTENPDIRYSTRDTSMPSDLDLALSAADEIVDGGGDAYWASLLESDPGIAGEAEEIKRLGKQLKKTEADLAEARRNLTLTDRKLKTRGIASLAATIMQDQKAGDVNHNDVQKRITAVLTEAYQKALDQLDAGADVSDAWETVYQKGVVKAADILLRDATHSEKISYKWYTKTLGEYLGEGAREYVEDSRRAANVPSLQASTGGKQRTAECRPYRRVRAGSNGRQSAVPTGECGREATDGRVPSLQASVGGKQRTAECRPYRRVRAGSNGRLSAVPTGECGREVTDGRVPSLQASADGKQADGKVPSLQAGAGGK